MPKFILLQVGQHPCPSNYSMRGLFKTGTKACHYGPKGLQKSKHCFAFNGVLPKLFLSLNPDHNSHRSTDLNVIRSHLTQPSEES